MESAGWFWGWNNLNDYADKKDWYYISTAINSGDEETFYLRNKYIIDSNTTYQEFKRLVDDREINRNNKISQISE